MSPPTRHQKTRGRHRLSAGLPGGKGLLRFMHQEKLRRFTHPLGLQACWQAALRNSVATCYGRPEPQGLMTFVLRPETNACFGNPISRRDVLLAVLIDGMILARTIYLFYVRSLSARCSTRCWF